MSQRRRLREHVIDPIVAITVTLAVLTLIGGLLVLLEPPRPGTAISNVIAPDPSAGGPSEPSIGGAPGPADPAPAQEHYGSGKLGSWQNLARRIASEDQIRDALMFNGIFMFGDSISVQDGAALERMVTAKTGDPIASHDWSGEPASAAVDALAEWSHHYGLPGRIVMAVGTNDIFDPPAFAAQVERTMEIVGPVRTVYWVNVHAGRFKKSAAVRAADERNSAWINQQLDQAAARHPNLKIVRWAEYLATQPSGPATYLRDGVHTTEPVGQDARNSLILRAIQGH